MNQQVHSVFPYLRTSDANAAIAFYQAAFGATEEFVLREPSGRIGHAELRFGDAIVMVSDAYPEYGIHAPDPSTPTGAAIHLHVGDVDAVTAQAVAAGAKVVMEPKDQFYGEHTSKVLDPFGHEWLLGSEIEKLSNDEIQKRYLAMFGSE